VSRCRLGPVVGRSELLVASIDPPPGILPCLVFGSNACLHAVFECGPFDRGHEILGVVVDKISHEGHESCGHRLHDVLIGVFVNLIAGVRDLERLGFR